MVARSSSLTSLRHRLRCVRLGSAVSKSTLAALIRHISETRPVHVLTIEDPMEFLFNDGMAAISQREVGTDTTSFTEALRNGVRQDPDVMMVGEMRDVETMTTVITAAETGHLVFSTLHTNSATQTIDRILDSFPGSQHKQVRAQLAQVLKGVVSMKLVERQDGSGLVAALASPANTVAYIGAQVADFTPAPGAFRAARRRFRGFGLDARLERANRRAPARPGGLECVPLRSRDA